MSDWQPTSDIKPVQKENGSNTYVLCQKWVKKEYKPGIGEVEYQDWREVKSVEGE